MLKNEMVKTDGDSHAELTTVEAVASRPADELPPVPTMSVTWIDKLAIENLVEGDADEIARLRAMHAETMNGLYAEPAAARLRVLARTISVLRAKVMILEGLSDRMLAARDLAAVAALQKTLDATTRRMTMLLAEHRLATQGDQRRVSVAVVGQAQVNVSGLR